MVRRRDWQLVEAILARGDLDDYHLAHAARADLYRRLGQPDEAQAAYEQALSLVRQEPERRFLEERLAANWAKKVSGRCRNRCPRHD